MLRLNFPQQASFQKIANMIRYAHANRENEDHIVFDYSHWEHCPAGGALLASAFIRQFTAATCSWYPDREVYIEHTGYEGCTYPGHLGFFRSIGVPWGFAPGEARSGERLLPISKLDFNVDTPLDSPMAKDRLTDELKERSASLAEMLTRSYDEDLLATVDYSVREILRNVVEHSGQGTCWYCAQYWPTKPRVELSILDEGVGIFQSMRNTGRLPVQSEEQAMDFAVLPGYSRHGINPCAYNTTTGIGNTGLGLFMLSQLFGTFPGDQFEICSGNQLLKCANGSGRRLTRIPWFQGTAIRVTADTRNFTEIQNRLDAFSRIAEQEFKLQIGNTASASARLKL